MLTKIVNGVVVQLTPEEETAQLAEWAAARVLIDSQEWLRNRIRAYPPIGEQFDKIFHEGLDGWKADIQAIKDLYPKPE